MCLQKQVPKRFCNLIKSTWCWICFL